MSDSMNKAEGEIGYWKQVVVSLIAIFLVADFSRLHLLVFLELSVTLHSD